VGDAISILRGLKDRYEAHHGVRIQDAALVEACQLSDRYITARKLPDKAIDLVHYLSVPPSLPQPPSHSLLWLSLLRPPPLTIHSLPLLFLSITPPPLSPGFSLTPALALLVLVSRPRTNAK